jgi:hypothetical protein
MVDTPWVSKNLPDRMAGTNSGNGTRLLSVELKFVYTIGCVEISLLTSFSGKKYFSASHFIRPVDGTAEQL